ncbi:citrate synthase [Actinoplanes cyaneus]|uniref:citrate synthase (unknown stereospecificity) n=1 Tax=Actinoplanes cyaneus TaxID=52696 RepID=A0A919IGU5_9ACTN|nr:citrate synthase [Actinoplanes cyaneus]MCW2137681.1 citrate synthase [Actinoplanes cyaneus]GID65112.1 citrate synthase [Actinoplanes cyaneus]
MRQFLTTDQVAERLGVKPATVYAYVSRGLLPSRRNAAGKGSLFAKADVDALIAGRKRATPNIQTGVTLIRDGGLFYRGHDATELARDSTYEAVANLLWTGELDHAPFPANPEFVTLASRVGALLPSSARLADRLRVTVAAIAAADPLRFDTTPAAVQATGRALTATMVAALPLRAPSPAASPSTGPAPVASDPSPGSDLGPDPDPGSRSGPALVALGSAPIAEVLWPRLTAQVMSESGRRTMEAALILLADHDIAASTLAARVAASTRAHPYAVVGAGLAALDGPLHGAASEHVYPLLVRALAGEDPVQVVSEHLRVSGGIPGFGHPLYPSGDPRAAALFALLGDHPVHEAACGLADAVRSRSGIMPNIDLTLAAFALRYGMPADAGEAVFAVARTAGWLAHALEEYANRPARFRPTGQYSGRPPA